MTRWQEYLEKIIDMLLSRRFQALLAAVAVIVYSDGEIFNPLTTAEMQAITAAVSAWIFGDAYRRTSRGK